MQDQQPQFNDQDLIEACIELGLITPPVVNQTLPAVAPQPIVNFTDDELVDLLGADWQDSLVAPPPEPPTMPTRRPKHCLISPHPRAPEVYWRLKYIELTRPHVVIRNEYPKNH